MFRPLTKAGTLGRLQPQPWNVPHWLREQLHRLYSSLFGGSSPSEDERKLRTAEAAYRRGLTDRERERARHRILMRFWLDSASSLH